MPSLLKPKASSDVPGAGIVLEDIEPESVCAMFVEGTRCGSIEELHAKSTVRCADRDAFQFDGAML